MTDTGGRIPLAELLARGVSITVEEALAVVQTLLATGVRGTDPHRPLGPPSPATVLIGEDGSVVLRGCSVTPLVFEIAILLHQLLPPGKAGVSAALRFTVARAQHEVAAPPFESLDQFSHALTRFEVPARDQIVRALFARGAAALVAPVSLRRRGRRPIGFPIGVTMLAGFILIGVGEAMHQDRQPSAARPPARLLSPPAVDHIAPHRREPAPANQTAPASAESTTANPHGAVPGEL